MNNKTFSWINTSQDTPRLDSYLFIRYPEYSRSYFKKLIDHGCVSVNNKIITKSSLLLKQNDHITVVFAINTELSVTPQQVDFAIIDENNQDFLIINKPAGLVVHNAASNPNAPSLVRGLLYRYPEFTRFEDAVRPGIVHRLDKDTSGIIIVARTTQAQIALAKKFKDRTMQKTYLALVHGEPEKEFIVELPIGRHPVHRHKMTHYGIAPRKAKTIFKTLTYFEGAALVEATLITGRTHQIRVHLAAINHSIIGDAIYGKKSPSINRQALHAWKLEFDYNNLHYRYESPLPDDMRQIIDRLSVK